MQGKKAFTLIELLAVVVILGIIMMISIPAVNKWIDRGKEESRDAQKNTLVMATQSYAQDNSSVLPKVIGQTTVVTAEELKNAKYLKEDLYDTNKKKCMDSRVRIYKYDKSGYSYTAYIYCEGDTVPDSIIGVEPTISISFSGNKQTDGIIHEVAISSFKATISGGSNGSIKYGIDGYSYSVSVKYTEDSNEEVVEIYNSGSLNAGGRETLVVEKDLREYVDITKVNEFIVTVDAYNRDGGYKKEIASSLYHDTNPPICGKITGEGKWLKALGSKRTISVLCSDGNGSGCVKDKFTKTFDTEMEYGVVTIEDNAGNKTDCTVKVYIDWTTPSLTINAYKRTPEGTKTGDPVASITLGNNNPTGSISSYINDYGTNHWLNKTYYPDGIIYELEEKDNIVLDTAEWHYNDKEIFSFSSNNVNDLNNVSTKQKNTTNIISSVSFSANGIRKGKYVLKDKAENQVTVNISANLDHTLPSCETTKTNTGTVNGVTVTVICSDNESGIKTCPSGDTGLKQTKTYTSYDKANNSRSSTVTVTPRLQSNTCGKYNSCATSPCGCKTAKTCTCTRTARCLKCCPFAGEGMPYWTTKSYCPTGLVCNAGNCSEEYTCTSESACGCKTYNTCSHKNCGCKTWSGWVNDSSCSSEANVKQCRTLYD